MLIFSLTIFLGALLLFQVELIIGKYILPWFGGTSAVWITCMLFFQLLLLAGYAYGHLLDSRARDRAGAAAQTWVHRALLLLSLGVLGAQFVLWHSPLILDASWKPRADGNPLLQILTLLAVSVGLPYLVLASTAPLLQSWWRRLYPQRSPYPLYAVSNFGSFLGLVSYPFLVEPFLTLRAQARMWSGAYVAFAAGCAYCAMRAAGARADAGAAASAGPAAEASPPAPFPGAPISRLAGLHNADAAPPQSKSATTASPAVEPLSAGVFAAPRALEESQRPATGIVVLWLALAACASALLLATTNQLCKNVAAVPLLWVLPLAIYLLTFTLCFESDRRYSRAWFHPAFALGIFLICFVLATGAGKQLVAQIAIYSFGLFAACMVCHGELARLKPDPRHLTFFYLIVAAGGVIGGLFVALAAPYLFLGYWEYEISLWLAALLFLVVLVRDHSSWLYSKRVRAPLVLLGAAALLPESMALAIGSTQLAGTLPSVVVIVGALFLLQGQSKRRKREPEAVRGAQSKALSLTGEATIVADTLPIGGPSPAQQPAISSAFPGSANLPIGGFAHQQDSAGVSPSAPTVPFAREISQAANVPAQNATAPVAPRNNLSLLASCAIVLLVLGASFTTLAKASLGQIASMRNFYGALTIDRQNPDDPEREAYAMKHGEIVHGFEFRAPARQMIPTSYFSEDSGLGLLLAPHLHAGERSATPSAQPEPANQAIGAPGNSNFPISDAAPSDMPLRIGDIGLGIGTVAAYARPGDTVRFYEINPEVVGLASDPRYFDFLHGSAAAPVDVVLGDGRLSLERELAAGASEDYDVLVVDAFNGDAVPVHLLTIEAFELYLRRLKNPGGVLAMNVTNTFLDLRPVVVAAAEKLGLASVWVHCDGDQRVSYTNDWVLVSRDRARLRSIAAQAKQAAALQAPETRLWTDDYSNLFQALRDKSRAAAAASQGQR